MQVNHAEYQAKVKTQSEAELRFTIADCRAALDALPTCDKAGYYADEIAYASAELRRREVERKVQTSPLAAGVAADTLREIVRLIRETGDVRTAMNHVLGAGAYEQLAGELYDELRARC